MALCGFLSPGSGVYTAVSLMLGVLVSGNPPSRLTAQGKGTPVLLLLLLLLLCEVGCVCGGVGMGLS